MGIEEHRPTSRISGDVAGIHAASEFIAGGPKGGVEIGFLDGHSGRESFVRIKRSKRGMTPRARSAA
jgi:hypothetical protein